jgi:DNA-binding protein HU-beta
MAKGMTKSEFIGEVAEKSGLSKKDVNAVFEAVLNVAVEQLKKGHELTLPGMAKLKAVHKPAKPAREGTDPFTKQPRTFAAKPASTAVKIRPVKALKDAVM